MAPLKCSSATTRLATDFLTSVSADELGSDSSWRPPFVAPAVRAAGVPFVASGRLRVSDDFDISVRGFALFAIEAQFLSYRCVRHPEKNDLGLAMGISVRVPSPCRDDKDIVLLPLKTNVVDLCVAFPFSHTVDYTGSVTVLKRPLARIEHLHRKRHRGHHRSACLRIHVLE